MYAPPGHIQQFQQYLPIRKVVLYNIMRLVQMLHETPYHLISFGSSHKMNKTHYS